MFLSTEAGGVQPKVIFVYLILVVMYRILYQMAYFKTFGPIVQIIIKMIANCFVFLIISLMFLISFTIMGYVLFYDIAEFSTIFRSFNTMYQSIFGGFDFTIYSNSSKTAEYYGRIYLCVFLLGFAVLIMNFLIAILSEVYSYYTGVANALHKRELVKLRAAYEPHLYYHCLVKAPIFINFYMIVMAPIVVIFKSERLNKALILIQYLTTIFFYEIGMTVNLILFLPLFIIIIVFTKLRYISSKSKGVIDAMIRLIDIVVLLLSIPIYVIILFSAAYIGETKLLFKSNFIKTIGIYSKQYQYANTIMDGSTAHADKEKLDYFETQKIYFQFKKFVNPLQSRQIKYNPTDYMISEVFTCLLISSMKIIKRNIQLKLNDGKIDDSIPLFIPTEYVINELKEIVFINEQFRAIVFGSTYSKKIDIDCPQFVHLVSALADKTLGGIEICTDEEVWENIVQDEGKDLMIIAATLRSYEQRYHYWKDKLIKLFISSNNQWIIDQFQFCKIFLYLNSFEADISEVNEDIWKVNNKLNLLYLKYKNNEGIQEIHKTEENSISAQDNILKQKIHLIDVPTFIGPIVGFEAKIRDIINRETNNGETEVSHPIYKECSYKSQVTLTRFLSSSMSSCYSACNIYSAKE